MVAQNAIIYASDYNTIQSTVAGVLGTGSSTLGYGQTVNSQQITSGSLISDEPTPTAYQWAALYADMVQIANHQGTSISSLTTTVTNNVAPGKIIYAADINVFSTTATTLQTNALTYAAGDMITTTGIITSQRTTAWGNNTTKQQVQHSFTVAFASYNAARYFFNTGGAVQFTASRSGGTTSTQNSDWTSTLTNIGTVTFNYNSTSAASGSGSAIGFYGLTASPQTLYSKSGGSVSSVYVPDVYTITASYNSVNFTITFNVVFNDAHDNAYSDSVDGTLTSSINLRKAGASYLTITAPTFTNSTLLSA